MGYKIKNYCQIKSVLQFAYFSTPCSRTSSNLIQETICPYFPSNIKFSSFARHSSEIFRIHKRPYWKKFKFKCHFLYKHRSYNLHELCFDTNAITRYHFNLLYMLVTHFPFGVGMLARLGPILLIARNLNVKFAQAVSSRVKYVFVGSVMLAMTCHSSGK